MNAADLTNTILDWSLLPKTTHAGELDVSLK